MAGVVGDMSDDVFLALATYASVGFFTAEEGTTIFPEYEHLRDRPECEGKVITAQNKEAVGLMAQLSACSHPSESNPFES